MSGPRLMSHCRRQPFVKTRIPLQVESSVLCHKYATFQRAAQGLWQGAARSQYRAY